MTAKVKLRSQPACCLYTNYFITDALTKVVETENCPNNLTAPILYSSQHGTKFENMHLLLDDSYFHTHLSCVLVSRVNTGLGIEKRIPFHVVAIIQTIRLRL